jgi:Family of unknown function (DUF6317)
VPADPSGSDGFQVVIRDLQQAAQTFRAEGTTFKGIMPGVPGPSVPDGGSAGFDTIAQAVVDAICALHLQISGDITGHGTKLQRAHDNYSSTEESLTTLIGQIDNPNAIK